MVLLFMVKNKNKKNQSKLGIITLDSAVPKNHIARYVVKFVDEYFDLLQFPEKTKKGVMPFYFVTGISVSSVPMGTGRYFPDVNSRNMPDGSSLDKKVILTFSAYSV